MKKGLVCGQSRFRALATLRLAIFSTGLAVFSQACSLRAADQACPNDGGTSATVISVNERLELTLDDGAKIKIAGIDPPHPTPDDPDLDARMRDELAQWLVGQDITFRQAEPGRDRWGRIAAFVFAPAPQGIPAPQGTKARAEPRLAVNEALIDAGFARYEPTAAAHPCRDALLAAEAGARAQRLGLWADPYYAVIAAGEHRSFAEKTGSSVIVEGRMTGMGGRRPRITLYFGPRKGLDFSVTILARNSKAFEAAYSSLAGLVGKTVRVRGLLDTRFGPQLEISDTDAVEVTGQDQGPAPSSTERQ
jgi:endonuclease YncB( thermonuclease family)